MITDVVYQLPEQVGVDCVPEDGRALECCGHLELGGVGVPTLGDRLTAPFRLLAMSNIR
jgi:hypothetical protein